MKHLVSGLVCAAFFVLGADQSMAQGLSPSAYFTYGSTRFAATESFETITGSSARSGVGFGGGVDGIWRGLFIDAGFSQRKLKGERVFVSNATAFPLGISTEMTYRPIDLAAGWRFEFDRVRPYVGGGATFVSYREDADFSETGDDVDERKTGALLLAGVDLEVLKYVRVGGELRYRVVTGVLGTGGVSELFGEDELGGIAFAARVSVGR
jgi:opacity protein-like surface antigen